MTIDRTRASWIVSGLAVVLFVPLYSNGVELKRLPPVESKGANTPPASPLSPVLSLPVPKEISQLVWHQTAAEPQTQVGSANLPRPVKLVNWNEEPSVPPVIVAEDPSGAPTTQFTGQLVSQPADHSFVQFASQPAAPSAVPPAPESAAEPTTPPLAETIEPGVASLAPDDGTDCASRIACCLPPCWYFQGDALVLGRSDVRTIKIVELGTGTPVRGQRDALLTTDALDLNPAWGPRITIGHYLNDVRNLEMTYFGLNHWKSVAAFDGINGVGFSFNNIDVPFDSNYTSDFDGGQYVSATYASEIHSAEINLLTNNRWDLNRSAGFPWYNYVDFLAGVRYFQLNEQFNLASTDTGDTSNYLIDTENSLIGGQVGMIAGSYHSERVSWNIRTKAGIYVNSAGQSTLMGDDNNTVLLRDFTTHDNELAFLGDTSFNIAYDLRPNVALTAGYSLLYVGGVALAPEQLDFTTTPTSGSELNQNGGAFYHGASFGLQFVY